MVDDETPQPPQPKASRVARRFQPASSPDAADAPPAASPAPEPEAASAAAPALPASDPDVREIRYWRVKRARNVSFGGGITHMPAGKVLDARSFGALGIARLREQGLELEPV